MASTTSEKMKLNKGKFIYVQVRHELFHTAGGQQSEHGLGHVNSVAPVVVFHRTIVLLDTQSPTA